MADIQGLNIAAPVAPYTTDDIYPTHFALYGRGGWRSVDTIAERDNIHFDRLEKGMIVSVHAVDKKYELLSFTSTASTWRELGLGSQQAGASSWGNIGGLLTDQIDLINFLKTNYVTATREFGPGVYAVGDTFIYGSITFKVNNPFSYTAAQISDAGGLAAVFKATEARCNPLFKMKKALELTPNLGAGVPQNVGPIDCMIYSDVSIDLTSISAVTLNVSAVNLVPYTNVNFIIKCFRTHDFVFDSASFATGTAVTLNQTIDTQQFITLQFIVNKDYKLQQLTTSGASGTPTGGNIYDIEDLKSDINLVFATASAKTVNTFHDTVDNTQVIQTAIKQWKQNARYDTDSIVRNGNLAFRNVGGQQRGEFVNFDEAYNTGRWEYVGHAATHRSIDTLSSSTHVWDWKNNPVYHVVSSNVIASTTVSLLNTAVYSGVEIALVYKRTSVQTISLNPDQFTGVPIFPDWEGTEQIITLNFRSIPFSSKFSFLGSGSGSLGTPLISFNGIFDITTRKVNLPFGTRSVLLFGMDNNAFIRPNQYTVDLTALPPTLTVSTALDELINGDQYWGTVAFSNASLGTIQSVQSVNGMTGAVTVTASSMGLAPVAQTGSYSDLINKPSLGIDYVSTIGLTAPATLLGDRTYHLSGASFSVTLPDPLQNLGKRILIRATTASTGLYKIIGSRHEIYAKESIEFLATTDGWSRSVYDKYPISIRITTDTAVPNNLVAAGGLTVPYTIQSFKNGPITFINNRITVERDAVATVDVATVLASLSITGFYQVAVIIVRDVATIASIAMVPVASPYANEVLGMHSMSFKYPFKKGDIIECSIYSSTTGKLRDDSPQPNTLTYNED